MPFPKGAQKGQDKGEKQQADLTVCGLCSGSFAEDEERIEGGRLSSAGGRWFAGPVVGTPVQSPPAWLVDMLCVPWCPLMCTCLVPGSSVDGSQLANHSTHPFFAIQCAAARCSACGTRAFHPAVGAEAFMATYGHVLPKAALPLVAPLLAAAGHTLLLHLRCDSSLTSCLPIAVHVSSCNALTDYFVPSRALSPHAVCD